MSRRKKQYVSRFVGLEHLVMDSPAFMDLTSDATKLLLFVCKRHDGENNGAISFSVREAATVLGITPNTAGKRFHELVGHGFLQVMSKGAFSVKTKLATLWRVTMYPSPGGKAATREYARWKPAENQNTVSLGDTHGITERYRDPETEGQTRPTVSPGDTVKASEHRPTVSPSDTLIDSSHRLAVLRARHCTAKQVYIPLADILRDHRLDKTTRPALRRVS